VITIDIPGYRALALAHLVVDYNGTLAVDGRLLDGTRERLAALARELTVHIVTGNTYGNASEHLAGCDAEVVCLPSVHQAEAKRRYVERLGMGQTAAIGNGRNDAAMLEVAALAIAVLGTEGLAVEALTHADIVVRHAVDALGLLLKPKRLIASLRS
jgi:Soluble P-type ATPase